MAAAAKVGRTYDQKWLDETFPFLPKDFDERYFQSAPEDQQTGHLEGGEEAELLNLAPSGQTKFRIPTVDLPVVFLPRNGANEEVTPTLDTVMIEPDLGRFTVTWRPSAPVQEHSRAELRSLRSPIAELLPSTRIRKAALHVATRSGFG